MKITTAFTLAFVLLIGFGAGWFGHGYWENKFWKTQSTLAIVSANDAARRGDLDRAIEYTTYALLLDRESPVADIQLKEFVNKRAGQIAVSKCKK